MGMDPKESDMKDAIESYLENPEDEQAFETLAAEIARATLESPLLQRCIRTKERMKKVADRVGEPPEIFTGWANYFYTVRTS